MTGRPGRTRVLLGGLAAATALTLAATGPATASTPTSAATPTTATHGPTHTATAPTATDSAPPAVPGFADPPGYLGHCRLVIVPVTLPTGQPEHLAGHLCQPTHGHPTTIQVLVHGGAYNSAYWSWPLDPERYSYTWAALAAGYPVLALDRLGDGQSSRPPSKLDTFPAQAATLHQVVTALRAGTVDHHRWQHVIEIGHSFGSAELAAQLHTWPADADAAVYTGSGHTVSAETTTLTHTGFAPAATLLTRFAGLDSGYLTSTTLAVRTQLLYRVADSDPAVRAFDQATRDTLAAVEASTRPADLTGLTQGAPQPTLLLDGEFDTHYCDGAQVIPEHDLDDCSSAAGLYASERSDYGACLSTAIVPGSGHDVTPEFGSRIAAALILRFAWATLPPNATRSRCAGTGPFPTVAAAAHAVASAITATIAALAHRTGVPS